MIKALYIFGFAVLFGGLTYHFAALQVFNLLVPKDAGSEQIAHAVYYGPDPRQTLNVFRPKQNVGNLPVLIFVHGGSWQDGWGQDYGFVGRAFAAQGYLTLVISYRLLPQHAYPEFIVDVAIATAWANQHASEYGGDGTRVYLVGHSAGAYNIALSILDAHYMKDAGVDASIIKGVAGLAGPYDFLPLDSPKTITTFGNVADLAATQPINFARRDAPPFLLLHGTADITVKPRNSWSLFKHLQDAGAHAKLIEYQDVSHVGIMLDIAKPLRGNAPVLDDIVRFFKDTAQ